LYRHRLQRGTLLTNRLALAHGKPLMRVRLDQAIDLAAIQQWLCQSHIESLNVAGPRESSQPGIGSEAASLLRRLFSSAVQLHLDM
jgi:hypothetical protein